LGGGEREIFGETRKGSGHLTVRPPDVHFPGSAEEGWERKPEQHAVRGLSGRKNVRRNDYQSKRSHAQIDEDNAKWDQRWREKPV